MNAVDQIFAPGTMTAGATPKKELGQEDFLKLLVAQLKNQDPNNPADNGEFLGQIAQFSMVSGIDDLGVSFDGIASSLYTNQAMQASQLVGKEVLIETSIGSRAADAPISGTVDVGDYASNVRLQVLDAAGSVVNVIELGALGAGSQGFNWNGLDAADEDAPAGSYRFVAEGIVDGELQGLPVQLYKQVESVSVDRANTSVLLNLADSQQVGFSQIREFR